MSTFLHEGERELQQAALDQLRLIGDVARYQADAIRFAAEIGIPKQRIHQLTGRSRTAINQTLAREAQRPRPPCDYCLRQNFQAARRGEEVPPLRDASGYLVYRIGDRPEIVAQRLCLEHLKEDCASRLPSSARWVVTPHMPNTPGQIVYSLGGLRDDSQMFRSYFGSGNFPEWDKIRNLLDMELAVIYAFRAVDEPRAQWHGTPDALATGEYQTGWIDFNPAVPRPYSGCRLELRYGPAAIPVMDPHLRAYTLVNGRRIATTAAVQIELFGG